MVGIKQMILASRFSKIVKAAEITKYKNGSKKKNNIRKNYKRKN